ncbi:MAG TPA: LLM class flavin-dependent oxidoreductase [bacterium]|nr:LLM class flavin-dependent oxidoreductase [bacterium]
MKIGFVVLLGVRPELGRPHRYAEVREMAVAAEAAGFDSIWLYDHLLYRAPGQPTRGIWEWLDDAVGANKRYAIRSERVY